MLGGWTRWCRVATLFGIPVAAQALGLHQKSFAVDAVGSEAVERPLHGRFLHFTDMHPDQYYLPGSRINDACHSTGKNIDAEEEHSSRHKGGKKSKKRKRRVGYWGAPVSVCDSPKHLIEATLNWLSDNWMLSPSGDEDTNGKGIDFILWTGDTARHDIDFTRPRNAQEIFDYNRWALGLVEQRFPGVPIVPNLGNNDIIPHNIMFPGPNSMILAYKDIWRQHIPDEEQATFQKGGYYAKQVIKDDLAVLSLNTLYWYDANAATRGCKGSDDPGTEQLDWMEETLDHYRNQSMQVHLIGHVPPTAGNYFANCYERYSDMALRYQDTIVGQHFGHMNIDAFFLQEEAVLRVDEEEGGRDGGEVHSLSLPSDLRKDFDLVPTKQKTNSDAYLPFFVAPSVVPTYLPTVRVWTYNVSRPLRAGKRHHEHRRQQRQPQQPDFELDTTNLDDSITRFVFNNSVPIHSSKRRHRRPRHGGKKHKKHRNLPRHTNPDSPSRKNSYLTMLGYSQWVLDLDKHNRRHRKEGHAALDYQLEYTTYEAASLWADYLGTDRKDDGHAPVPKHLLQRELIRLHESPPTASVWRWIEIRSRSKIRIPKRLRHLTNYGLPSFTVDHLLEWARELAGNDGMWKTFVGRIYTESGSEE